VAQPPVDHPAAQDQAHHERGQDQTEFIVHVAVENLKADHRDHLKENLRKAGGGDGHKDGESGRETGLSSPQDGNQAQRDGQGKGKMPEVQAG